MGGITSIMIFPQQSPYHVHEGIFANFDKDYDPHNSFKTKKIYVRDTDYQPEDKQEVPDVEVGDYVKFKQIYHRRDLIHKSKLVKSELATIEKYNINKTVGKVLEKQGTYLTVEFINAKGAMEKKVRVWVMYVTKIGILEYEKESSRLTSLLKSLAKKQKECLDRINQIQKNCKHESISTEESGLIKEWTCKTCCKILGVETKHLKDADIELVTFDKEWFRRFQLKRNVPDYASIKVEKRDYIPKHEIISAYKKNLLTRKEVDLVLFNTPESIGEYIFMLQ